jgi:hypothetical protein
MPWTPAVFRASSGVGCFAHSVSTSLPSAPVKTSKKPESTPSFTHKPWSRQLPLWLVRRVSSAAISAVVSRGTVGTAVGSVDS